MSAEESVRSVEKAVIDAAHIEHQREWSTRTFGPREQRGPLGPLAHLRKELDEVADEPTDVEEWVDVIILAFDGAWRAGHEPQQIIDAVKAKQAKNEARTWPDWRGVPHDQAIEHVRRCGFHAWGADHLCVTCGAPEPRTRPATKSSGEVVDLLAALQRSVDAAKSARRQEDDRG